MKTIEGNLNCCGGTISRATTYNRARNRGVWINCNKVGTPIDNDKNQIVHLETKNGVITIAIRRDW